MELQVSSASDGGFILRLVLRERLDREKESSHEFIVSAMDGGHPSLTGSMTIQVNVADANDNIPVFEQTTYEVTIPEDAAPQTVLLKVKATDRDLGANAEVVYALSERTAEEYGDVFGIDGVSGEIFLKDVLDYEGQTAYHVTVLAFDSGPESLPDQATVVVYVSDVNDNRPEIEISFLTPTGRPEVAENGPVGEFVAFISATDVDSGNDGGGDVECHVTSGTKEFAIERVYRSQYKAVTAVSFDREWQTSAEFVLECRDSRLEPRTSDATVRIAILDENDNAPTFTANLYSASILDNNEPGVVVVTVSAHDVDAGNNSVVTYRLDDDVIGDVFSVEPETGLIRANVVLDRYAAAAAASSRFEFFVYAEDRGLPVQTGSALVIVNVIDFDDELPVFGSFVFYVAENCRIGTEVGSVTPPLGGNSSVYSHFRYFIDEEQADQSAFRIDMWTGSIETIEELDRETRSVYRLRIVARHSTIDSAHHHHRRRPSQSTADVIIHVTDVNDNAPRFVTPDPHGNTTAVVWSDARAGTVVIVAEIDDDDDDDDVTAGSRRRRRALSFFISDRNGSAVDGLFRVDPRTGAVETDGDVRRFAGSTVTLCLTVVDGELPVLHSTVLFEVLVRKTEGEVKGEREDGRGLLFAGLMFGSGYGLVAVVVVVGLALVIFVLVVVLAVLCVSRCCCRGKRGTRRRRRSGTSRGTKSGRCETCAPPDVVCCRPDELISADFRLTGRSLQLAPPGECELETALASGTSSYSPGSEDSGRCGSSCCDPSADDHRLPRDHTSDRLLPPSLTAGVWDPPVFIDDCLNLGAVGHVGHLVSLVPIQTNAAGPRLFGGQRGQRENPSFEPPSDTLIRFLGNRDESSSILESIAPARGGVGPSASQFLRPLLRRRLDAADDVEGGDATWRMDDASAVAGRATCRMDHKVSTCDGDRPLRKSTSSSSRDECCFARESMKAGKYFTYDAVDRGVQ